MAEAKTTVAIEIPTAELAQAEKDLCGILNKPVTAANAKAAAAIILKNACLKFEREQAERTARQAEEEAMAKIEPLGLE